MIEIGDTREPGGSGPARGLSASTRRPPEDLVALFDEHRSDRRPHLAGMQQADTHSPMIAKAVADRSLPARE